MLHRSVRRRVSSGLLCLVLAVLLVSAAKAQSISLPSPLICEDVIAGQQPFIASSAPCLLGCGTPSPTAVGSLLPGFVNTTDIPYCEARCVRPNITTDQLARAPTCASQCQDQRAKGTIENYAWCMYYCVEGGALQSLVQSVTCIPSVALGSAFSTITQDGGPVTLSSEFPKTLCRSCGSVVVHVITRMIASKAQQSIPSHDWLCAMLMHDHQCLRTHQYGRAGLRHRLYFLAQ
jgi:hypothetical protein